MKYLLLFVDTEETTSRSETERDALSEKIGAWWGEHAQSGVILSGEQLQGTQTATTVRHDHGTVTIVDGPLAMGWRGRGPAGVRDADAVGGPQGSGAGRWRMADRDG
jgi:hypothetical protein